MPTWEKLMVVDVHGVVAPWQLTHSVAGPEGQREDIGLRQGVFVPTRKACGGLKSRYQDRFTAAGLLQWTHALVFEPDHSIPAAFRSLPDLSTWLCLHIGREVCSSSCYAHLLPGKEVVKQDCHGEP